MLILQGKIYRQKQAKRERDRISAPSASTARPRWTLFQTRSWLVGPGLLIGFRLVTYVFTDTVLVSLTALEFISPNLQVLIRLWSCNLLARTFSSLFWFLKFTHIPWLVIDALHLSNLCHIITSSFSLSLWLFCFLLRRPLWLDWLDPENSRLYSHLKMLSLITSAKSLLS